MPPLFLCFAIRPHPNTGALELCTDADNRQNIKEGITGKPVSWYADVFDIVFPKLDRERTNKLWKDALKQSKKDEKKRKERDDSDDDD